MLNEKDLKVGMFIWEDIVDQPGIIVGLGPEMFLFRNLGQETAFLMIRRHHVYYHLSQNYSICTPERVYEYFSWVTRFKKNEIKELKRRTADIEATLAEYEKSVEEFKSQLVEVSSNA
ncbi:MAG: hypothetical protein WCT18_01375 [Patescibacteria group bacterium]